MSSPSNWALSSRITEPDDLRTIPGVLPSADSAREFIAGERYRRKDLRARVANLLATRHGLVVLEELTTRDMTASAKGTIAEPGKQVAQKAGLNRAILGEGWHMFELAVDNVARQTGRRIVKVPAAYTSQRCSACRTVDPASRESRAVYRCTTCGHTENADVNAARTFWPPGWRSQPVETSLSGGL